MAQLLAVLACAVLTHGASVPSFRFNYNDGTHAGQGVSQFYSGADAAFLYNWGYQYPGQSHTESKTRDGNVKGNYQFTDANGVVQKTSYSAGPGVGFSTVSEYQQQPQVYQHPQQSQPQAVVAPAAQIYGGPAPIQLSSFGVSSGFDSSSPAAQAVLRDLASQGVGLDIGSKQAIERASPNLLAAVRAGFLEPLRAGKDEIVFVVSNSLVDETRGSVSALATVLDADVVAARHDQQIVRQPGGASFYSAPQEYARAILETEYLAEGPRYVVRVPYY